ncbi:hypothetical protein O3597_14735 [Verrucosispora sp. WMMA2044]|uniref:hypothetical protein n=1 Tax=Verrucosispora sp. WMMA2044 TaxID=3016419 RepID=UPI000C1A6B6F|nr:hypothetical protein [Verrucosispora sp. WMMA2044]WBB46464.1 hypothetical protein O3597_14735 [Verrucosispora sp. WMMA2044]
MSHVRIRIAFTPLADDDEFVLGELTDELADDLREVGDVSRVERATVDPAAKGVAELTLGVVTVLAGTEPGYVQALVDVVLAFLQRHTGRRVHLRVGDIELTIDQPTHAQTDELISTVRAAIDRSRP